MNLYSLLVYILLTLYISHFTFPTLCAGTQASSLAACLQNTNPILLVSCCILSSSVFPLHIVIVGFPRCLLPQPRTVASPHYDPMRWIPFNFQCSLFNLPTLRVGTQPSSVAACLQNTNSSLLVLPAVCPCQVSPALSRRRDACVPALRFNALALYQFSTSSLCSILPNSASANSYLRFSPNDRKRGASPMGLHSHLLSFSPFPSSLRLAGAVSVQPNT